MSPELSVACVGGGPAGLFFAILAKQLDAVGPVTVLERYPEGVTHGWGVVFWDDLLADLEASDPPTAEALRRQAFRWTDQIVHVRGRDPIRVPSHGYSMGRRALLALLTARARELGVDLRHEIDVADRADVAGHDLVVAGDGVRSRLRDAARPAFGTAIAQGRNRYIWLGTSRVFDSFMFPCVESDGGWVWAHAYGFDRETSTFIVEMQEATWQALGFAHLGPEDTLRRLEEVFAPWLDGHALRHQSGVRDSTPWLTFQTVTNERWHDGNLALVGDAAHTTHFTIGSGTRLALEDAIALSRRLAAQPDLQTALVEYETERIDALQRAQREARNSARWFEELPRYAGHRPATFAALLDGRRSSFLAHLPPRVYLALRRVRRALPRGR